MTDDIVTRLRNWHDQRDSWQTLTEAADEIERLRADCDRWFKICSGMAECLDSSTEASDLLWSYEKAVRDE